MGESRKSYGISKGFQLPDNIRDIDVRELCLSYKLTNILRVKHIFTVGELINLKSSNIKFISENDVEAMQELREINGSLKKQVVRYFFSRNQYVIPETDMQVYTSKLRNDMDKIFAQNPLLGNKLLSVKVREQLHTFMIKCVDVFLNKDLQELSIRHKQQITMAVIGLAKEWDNQDEASFWSYIAGNIGYRDEQGKIRDFLCNCVYDALHERKRFFVESKSGKQYRTTIMIHAMAPKHSWLSFVELVFDFYRENLHWYYKENDPLIQNMVNGLRLKLAQLNDLDDNLSIGGKLYSVREGIKKLLLHRPEYMCVLVNDILRDIDIMMDKKYLEPHTYLDELCYEWYIDRITGLEDSLENKPAHNRRTQIESSKNIRPRYILNENNDIIVFFQETRLDFTDFDKIHAYLYVENELAEDISVPVYGNDLGKTLMSFQFNLSKHLNKCKRDFPVKVTIDCDACAIYDSSFNSDLYREILCFKGSHEINVKSCKAGELYTIFIPTNRYLNIEGDYEKDVVDDVEAVDCYYLRMSKGFVLKLNGEVIVRDDIACSQSNNSSKVLYPETMQGAKYIKGGKEYKILSNERNKIVFAHREIFKRYKIYFDSKHETKNEDITIENSYEKVLVPLNFDEDNCCYLCIYDMENKRIIAQENYKLIPHFDFKFNKSFYFSKKDFDTATVTIYMADEKYISACNEDSFIFPYEDGEIEISTPVVHMYNKTKINWGEHFYIWREDINIDERLLFSLPEKCEIELYLGMYKLRKAKKGYAIGKKIIALQEQDDWVEVIARIIVDNEEKDYVIGHVATKEKFRTDVIFEYRQDGLYWNRGGEFIGNQKSKLLLKIDDNNGEEILGIPLSLDQEKIDIDPEFPIGKYNYRIVKKSESIFRGNEIVVSEGELIIGDKFAIEFQGYRIKIKYVTSDSNNRYRKYEIKNTYVDNITYKGTQFVSCEGKECHVYEGIMYCEKNERKEYSYTDDESQGIYKVNPVKIVYIGDGTVSIKNEDDDGLYFKRTYKKKEVENVYSIIDREPPRDNKNDKDYDIADLYVYKKERIYNA